MSPAGSRLAATILSLALSPILSAQSTSKPLSPGEVLLLSNTADSAAAAIELKRALAGPDASARAAAARVIAVVPFGNLRVDLIGALAREQDPKTGAEMVHDLALLSGAVDLAMLDGQMHRLGADAVLALAEWLARERPQDFSQRQSAFASIADTRAKELAPIVAMGGFQHPADADSIYRAWMTVAPKGAWDTALERGLTSEGIPDRLAPVISDALDSTRDTISEETVWFVLECVLKKRRIAREIVAKASQPREGVTSWEAFGRELLARGSSAQEATDRHEIVEREGPSHTPDLWRLHAAQQLTADERAAVLAIVPLPKGPTFETTGSGDQAHTFSAFAPGIIGSTLAAAGCDIRAESIGVSLIAYGTNGRPSHITIDPSGLTPQCQAALTAFARTSLLPPSTPRVENGTETLMLPIIAGFVACADAPPAPRAPSQARALPDIDAPKKTKDVRPLYPPAAQRAGIQGIVVLEAMISATGCIPDARIVRSIPALDIAAMRAVLGWTFQPARIDGSPAPAVMTVTVNFVLR